MKATALVKSGVCGLGAEIEVDCPAMFEATTVKIVSECPKVQKLAEKITELDGMSEMATGHAGKIYTAAQEFQKGMCSSCVVPNAVYKATMIANGLALAKDVEIILAKVD